MKTPKQECEELLNVVVPFARQMLTAERAFLPFGATMSSSGEIAHVGGWTEDEHPRSVEVIELLEGGFRSGAAQGDYRATALAVDMLVVPPRKSAKQDAIAVRLDHRDGYSAVVVFPYSFSPDGELLVEAPYAVRGENRIFGRPVAPS